MYVQINKPTSLRALELVRKACSVVEQEGEKSSCESGRKKQKARDTDEKHGFLRPQFSAYLCPLT
jgi:hypothetical protein